MSPHQTRVVTERDELHIKLVALKAFTSANPIFHTLPREDQSLMLEQVSVMGAYVLILNERIARF